MLVLNLTSSRDLGIALTAESLRDESEKNLDLAKFLAAIGQLKETGKSVAGLFSFINKSIIKSAVEQRYYWDKMMCYINKHKKHGATVIVTTALCAAGKIFDPFVNDINNHNYSVAGKYHYTVAKLPKMKLNSVVTEPMDGSKDTAKVAYIFHPNQKQQKQIASIILKAYKKAK